MVCSCILDSHCSKEGVDQKGSSKVASNEPESGPWASFLPAVVAVCVMGMGAGKIWVCVWIGITSGG